MNNIPILIIDDQVALLRSLSLMLRTQRFPNVSTLEEPLDIHIAIKKQRPKLVLLDLNMPTLCGKEVLKKISANYPNIYTIIISADDSIENKKECKKLGAYDFLNKPIIRQELITCIEHIMTLDK